MMSGLDKIKDDLDNIEDGSICSSRHREGEEELCQSQAPGVNLWMFYQVYV